MQQVMYKHLQEHPQPLSSFNPNIPPGVDSVILRALEKKPEDRFPSMQAFATAFEQAWQVEETIKQPPLPPNRYATSPVLPMSQAVTPPPTPAFQSASLAMMPKRATNAFQFRRAFSLSGMVIGILIALLGGLWLTSAPADAQFPYHNDSAGGSLVLFTGLMIFFIARIRKNATKARRTETLIGRITGIIAILCGILAVFRVGGPGGLDPFRPYVFGVVTILVGIVILWVTAI